MKEGPLLMNITLSVRESAHLSDIDVVVVHAFFHLYSLSLSARLVSHTDSLGRTLHRERENVGEAHLRRNYAECERKNLKKRTQSRKAVSNFSVPPRIYYSFVLKKFA